MSACTTYVAMGSNLGDSNAILDSAVTALQSQSGVERLVESPRYLTDPMGPQDQPDYLNSVCRFETTLKAHVLLDRLQAIEIECGRVRPEDEASIVAMRWHARTLDLDLLLYGDSRIHDERLTVPHAGIAQRSFVLKPLHDLDPSLEIAGVGPVVTLLGKVATLGIRPA